MESSMMDRRLFLRGALALSAVSVAVPSLAFDGAPTIYGDGIHDDWAGLQAMFDGRPFHVDDEIIVAGEGVVSGGDFILSRTLSISGDGILVTNSRFTARDWRGKPYLFLFKRATNSTFYNVHLDCRDMHSFENADAAFTFHNPPIPHRAKE